jgi:hypothetical protein
VGEFLMTPLRISVRPVGLCVRGPVTRLRHRRLRNWVPSPTAPAIRVVREGEGRRSYSLSSASTDHDAAHRWPAPFRAPRMLTLRRPSRSLKSLHHAVSISDVLLVTRRHTRVGVLVRPMCWPSSPLLADGDAELDLRARGPCFALLVRARRATARERLPSYREPASRDPQAVHRRLVRGPAPAHRFAF